MARACRELLVDQGEADNFLDEQLRPELLEAACDGAGIELTLRLQPGYDHSYYFISTFMADHLRWHAAAVVALTQPTSRAGISLWRSAAPARAPTRPPI